MGDVARAADRRHHPLVQMAVIPATEGGERAQQRPEQAIGHEQAAERRDAAWGA